MVEGTVYWHHFFVSALIIILGVIIIDAVGAIFPVQIHIQGQTEVQQLSFLGRSLPPLGVGHLQQAKKI